MSAQPVVDTHPVLYDTRKGRDGLLWEIWQSPPQYMTVPSYEDAFFRWPVPWMVWLWCPPRTLVITCRTQPLTAEDEQLYWPHLSNIYHNGTPCGGVPRWCQGALSAIDYFWNSTFETTGGHYLGWEGDDSRLPREHPVNAYYNPPPSRSVADHYADYRDLCHASVLEKYSTEDILEWEWIPARTVNDMLSTRIQDWGVGPYYDDDDDDEQDD